MKAWRLALTVACIASLGFPIPATSQQRQGPPTPKSQSESKGPAQSKSQAAGDTFAFRVCNRDPDEIPLFISMLFRTGANSWRAVGWFDVGHGECRELPGQFPREGTFWYAEDSCCPVEITYSGKDAFACTNPQEDFDRTISGNYQCTADERVSGYSRVTEDLIRNGLTLQ